MPTAQPARYIDIHVLQTVPYANLNRDDLGAPKTVVYGGVERTRVSSQCWKRATRLAIEDEIGQRASRTRRVAEQIERRLLEDGWPADLAKHAAQQVVLSAGEGLKLEKNGNTSALLYLPDTAIAELAAIATEHVAAIEKSAASTAKTVKPVLPKAEINEVIASRNAIINLFGRMLAELPGANVDGAVQVAHAFTTHATDVEVDFFTAVDDVNDDWEDDAGSAHMNSAEFSAGVFYRYATLNVTDLAENLGPDDAHHVGDLAGAFTRAFILAMPGAKKTSTAPHTVPDLVHIAVRAARPLSLAAAFETPVRPDQVGGWAAPSRRALDSYSSAVHKLLGQRGLLDSAHTNIEDKQLDGLGDRVDSYDALVERAVAAAVDEGA